MRLDYGFCLFKMDGFNLGKYRDYLKDLDFISLVLSFPVNFNAYFLKFNKIFDMKIKQKFKSRINI